jgi:D-alanyl-D-alanine carboxypeptidase (penicillin-binding protein 5/6)
MRVIEPYHFEKIKHHRPRHRLFKIFILLTAVVFLSYSGYAYSQPLPEITHTEKSIEIASSQVNLAWPVYGQAAIGAVGYGVVATKNTGKSQPIASVAKIITALAVLKKYPLKIGETGPRITITAIDIDNYNHYVSMNGSTVKVQIGEQLTQYQALQAMLIPSGNNIADALARWAYGSIDGYTVAANNMIQSLDLRKTHVADASGFSPQTTSIASDLVKLGIYALANPIIAQITSQPSAELPIAGTIYNTNRLLGKENISGIKTGNTDQAGGCFLSASSRVIDNTRIVLVTAIMGAPNISTALRDTPPLVSSGFKGFSEVSLISKDQILGNYSIPWGGQTNVLAGKDITGVVWAQAPPKARLTINNIHAPLNKGSKVGNAEVMVGNARLSIPLVLGENIETPSTMWRLTRKVL